MRRKNFFAVKLVAVTLMLGLFSPSISIEQSTTSPKMTVLSQLSTAKVSFTLFHQAEARKYKKRRYRKARRKSIRRNHRRANYRHHRRSRAYHRGRNRRSNTGAVVGAAVVGAVIGAAINEASHD
ncbi:MAG: hypothetical protein GQ531_06490 [Sulfurovum sp.]|nr:hypothetical protein [Sulfurovum sp.]